MSGWRTVKELTEELRFSSAKACRSWLARQGIQSVRRGRVILVSVVDVDRALRALQPVQARAQAHGRRDQIGEGVQQFGARHAR